MIRKTVRYGIAALACLLVFGGAAGCDTKEEKAVTAKPVMAPGAAETAAQPGATAAVSEKKPEIKGIAIDVNGVKLTKAELHAEIEQRLAKLQGRIPAESLEKAKLEIRKRFLDEFVMRTLLNQEIAAKKVTASEKEIDELLASMKEQLPPGKTLDDLMAANGIDIVKMREEIGTNIKLNKLLTQELGEKIKVSEKEIAEYYQKNREQFLKPETVHARHLLVAKVAEETEKTKAAKRAKAEELRKRLLAKEDFAGLAAKNSDCPSKQNGGDLGTFSRGQMVKPFEDAAFSQKKMEIGPVVETEFGYHIIQVLEHQAEEVVKLEGEAKKRIIATLERQKQQDAFEGMLKRLKAKANILVYG